MMDFEDQLRKALRGEDAPAGFANRVLARLPEVYPVATPKPVFRRVMLWAAAVLLCAVSVAGWQAERMHEERVQGERASAQVMLALRITGTKLNHAESRVRQATVDDGKGNGEQ